MNEKFIDNYVNSVDKADYRSDYADKGGNSQRLDRKRRKAVNPEQEQLADCVARLALEPFAVVNLDVFNLIGNSYEQSADVGEGVGIAQNLVGNIALAGKVAHNLQILRLADKPLSHFVVDLAAEVSKAGVHFVLVLGKNQVAAVVKRVNEFEHLVCRRLSVVVKGYGNVARHERKARHKRRVLSEVAREVDSLDVRIFRRELFDYREYVVGRTVVYEDNLVIIPAVSLNGGYNLIDNRADCMLRAVARNNK